MIDALLVLSAGVAAGVLNAIGGGGTFVALPALVALGLPPVTANAVSRVALVPGALASAWVYRREVAPVGKASTKALTAVSVAGGGVGAGLLLVLPASSFEVAVPWLLAFATATLALGRHLSRALHSVLGRPVDLGPGAVLSGQFFLAVYGGYFGGAVGIMMMALWSIGLGLDAAAGNPMRVTQLAAVYLSATVLFLFASDALSASLPLAAMLVGAVAGGFAGAHLARRLPARLLRGVLLTTAAVTTVLYFLRGWPRTPEAAAIITVVGNGGPAHMTANGARAETEADEGAGAGAAAAWTDTARARLLVAYEACELADLARAAVPVGADGTNPDGTARAPGAVLAEAARVHAAAQRFLEAAAVYERVGGADWQVVGEVLDVSARAARVRFAMAEAAFRDALPSSRRDRRGRDVAEPGSLRAHMIAEPLETAFDLDDWVLRHADGDGDLGPAPVSGALIRGTPHRGGGTGPDRRS
ncbi:sulfite exporter TauE/SafE family protein [Streptomyces coelicoflavus]